MEEKAWSRASVRPQTTQRLPCPLYIFYRQTSQINYSNTLLSLFIIYKGWEFKCISINWLPKIKLRVPLDLCPKHYTLPEVYYSLRGLNALKQNMLYVEAHVQRQKSVYTCYTQRWGVKISCHKDGTGYRMEVVL